MRDWVCRSVRCVVATCVGWFCRAGGEWSEVEESAEFGGDGEGAAGGPVGGLGFGDGGREASLLC